MNLATKAAIDRLRKIAVHGPALMSVSREDAQRILAELDAQTAISGELTEAHQAAIDNGYQPHPVMVGYGAPQRLDLGDELAFGAPRARWPE